MKKNIIFDFDGTLVDSSSAINKLYAYFAKKYNISSINPKTLESIKALPLIEKMKKLGVPVQNLNSMSEEAKNVYSSYISEIRLKEGMSDILKALKERHADMFILSSNAADNIKKFLNLNNISFFKAVYSAEDILKKDIEISQLLKNYSIKKENATYVGDEVQDINACARIGIRIISVSWGNDSAEALKEYNPDYLCNTTEDLFKYLLSD
ncbi:MAG: HAD-IA family hydrolase [Actinomycetota bacterium]|nr:HAD-IA family hydrolase [Actinomycetota bacterium]